MQNDEIHAVPIPQMFVQTKMQHTKDKQNTKHVCNTHLIQHIGKRDTLLKLFKVD